MVTSQEYCIQAEKHVPQLVTCGVMDHILKNIPIPVVFFYKKRINHDSLINSLKKVLNDFPIFSGRLKTINHALHIDCNNQGVPFSITDDPATLDWTLANLPKLNRSRFVTVINSRQWNSNRMPLMTVKLTNLACGAMVLGICWHHSIGDMHTFMELMKAWSNTFNGKSYDLPLIVEKRDTYLEHNIEKNNNIAPGLRTIDTCELLRILSYQVFRHENICELQFYFSEDELTAMKKELSMETDMWLSRNDVLCAHIFSLISELDSYQDERCLSILVNYRRGLKLPDNLLGNYISILKIMNIKREKSSQLAQEIRSALTHFKQQYMDFYPRQEYIAKKGGFRNTNKIMDLGIDPVRRTLLVTSWAKFGMYDISFGDVRVFYFTPFGKVPLPWLSTITEGALMKGLIYSVSLPRTLANRLRQDSNLQRMHQYRPPNSAIPNAMEKLAWLL